MKYGLKYPVHACEDTLEISFRRIEINIITAKLIVAMTSSSPFSEEEYQTFVKKRHLLTLAKNIGNISGFSAEERREIQEIREKLHLLSKRKAKELYDKCVSIYPKMKRWKVPETTLRGSRGTWCTICNRKTQQVMMIDSARLRLHVGLFCPKCDKTIIKKHKKAGAHIMPSIGTGPNVPYDSTGFAEQNNGPWRSKGDRDIGARSGKHKPGYIAWSFAKRAKIERKVEEIENSLRSEGVDAVEARRSARLYGRALQKDLAKKIKEQKKRRR